MKNNDLDDLIDKQSKELTDRELLEENFVSLHYMNKKINTIKKDVYWSMGILGIIAAAILYEFPPLWLR